MNRFLKYLILLLVVFNLRSLLIFTIENPQIYRFGGDSGYFTSAAQQMIKGEPVTGHSLSYIGYVFIVSLSLQLQLGYVGVVVFQIFLSLLAALALYSLVKCFSQDVQLTRLSTLFFLTNYELMKWNFFILSDSVYISLTVISLWLIIRSRVNSNYILLSGIVSLYAAVTRPNGFIIFMTWLIFGFINKHSLGLKRRLSGLILVVFALIMYKLLHQSAVDRGIFRYATNGEIIWSNQSWRLDPPLAFAQMDNSFFGVIKFTLQSPLYMLQLFVSKIFVEAFRIRPFLPLAYNLFLLANVIPLYAAALLAIKKHFLKILPMLFIVTAEFLLVGLTYADWDGRFLAYILPVIVVIASVQDTPLQLQRLKVS